MKEVPSRKYPCCCCRVTLANLLRVGKLKGQDQRICELEENLKEGKLHQLQVGKQDGLTTTENTNFASLY